MVNEAEIKETEAPSPVLYKFTNQEHSEYLDNLLAMFYEGTYGNTLGIMTAFNLEEGKEDVVLVGVVFDAEGKAECFPIAKVLSAEDVVKYLAPDGKGGYYDPRNPTEVAAAKESMRSHDEAVVDTESPIVN
jgi:hypothetical protein